MQHFSLIKLFTSFAMFGAEWVMWLLVSLSLLSVAVFLERWFYYRSLRDNLDKLGDTVNAKLVDGDQDTAKEVLNKSPSPAALVALAGLKEHRGPLAVERTMQGTLARVRPQLERNLGVLGTIGATAPFIGLFGTVIGVIQAFDALKAPEGMGAAAATAAGAAATGRVMGTIAEALVATAIGLGVAIPAVIAFNFLNRRTKLILASTEVLAQIVMAHAFGRDEQGVHVAPHGAGSTRRTQSQAEEEDAAGSTSTDVPRTSEAIG